jgi:hypothetical protein
MYTDVNVKLQIGKEEHDMPYTVGVQQGDNMAPILFLFVMQAFSKTLEEKWEKETRGLTKPTYRFHRSKKTKEATWPPALAKLQSERHHFRNSGPPLPR